MKVAVTFLLVALCCSLGTGNPSQRLRRQVRTITYRYYQQGGNAAENTEISKQQAQMFAFLFQGTICLYNAVRNGPQDKKPAAYRFIVQNIIRFVETYASSAGLSPKEMFLNQDDYNFYLMLLDIDQTGEYGNIGHIESTFDGLFQGLGRSVAGVLQGLGIVAADVFSALSGILGFGGNLLGGIAKTVGGVAGGLAHTAGNILGGIANVAGGLLGGVANSGDSAMGGATGGRFGGGLGGGFLGLIKR